LPIFALPGRVGFATAVVVVEVGTVSVVGDAVVIGGAVESVDSGVEAVSVPPHPAIVSAAAATAAPNAAGRPYLTG
jgi:hypothetical protein